MNNRFYFDTSGNDDATYEKAFKFALKISKANSNIKNIIFLVASKNNTGWLDRLYGSDTVKRLFRGFPQENVLVKIETVKTYSDSYSNSTDIVIACGLNSKEIFKVEDFRNIEYIIAIPWLKDLTQSWISTKNPTVLNVEGNDVRPAEQKNIRRPSGAVQKAFADLTSVINMSTGINHHMDNDRAKTYIRALFKYETELNSDLVCSYLINDLNWDVKHANEVRKLIDILNNGKYFMGGEKTGLQHYYKKWKLE